MIYFLWALALISVFIFCRFFLIPFIVQKYMFNKMARKIKKMQDNPGYSEETKKLLKFLEDEFSKASKETKL